MGESSLTALEQLIDSYVHAAEDAGPGPTEEFIDGARRFQTMLLKMVIDAHAVCKSECMNCPWCSGRICVDVEEHDQFCKWPTLKNEIEAWGKMR